MSAASPPDATQQLEVSSDRGTPPSSLPSPPTPRPTGPAAASGERGGTRGGGVAMRRPRSRRPARLPQIAVLSAALLAPAGRAEAQVLYGSIVGRVSDASQAAMPGATVTIVHQENNLAREATTNGDGAYRFVNLLPGKYALRVVLAGFKEHVEKDVPVSVNTVARVDLRLEVGNLSEVITVESGQTLLQTETGDLHAEFKSGEITALPLGNYRNYQTLLNLVPGTTPARFQNAVTDTP